MSDKNANRVIVVLVCMFVLTWVWFFVSKKDTVQDTAAPVQTTSVEK